MNDFNKINLALIAKANAILNDYGLWEILEKQGTPIIQGSYALNLMTWRDLDIHIATEDLTIQTFFNMGQEIATKLKPRRMSFRNELVGKTPNLPRGLYWGIRTMLQFPNEWKIDIWAMDSEEMRSNQQRFQELKAAITDEHRLPIFTIKSHYCRHPEHRKRFSTADIYKAVIEDNVESVTEFSQWLEKTKGIEQ